MIFVGMLVTELRKSISNMTEKIVSLYEAIRGERIPPYLPKDKKEKKKKKNRDCLVESQRFLPLEYWILIGCVEIGEGSKRQGKRNDEKK